ncbi:Chimaerin and related Rho GTPase activating proteins [Phaffia rhodozyma]|uniref:Chimaerin and related Rho GTPase activating proteins n=1 Tax=Phaffia rhodozyma TaxID=264483 RepID=A0A0F7SIU2_PHARH|nr:Chimaerin and related Rho GTPase activating proteins [Phaffia rhodozyma]
MDDPNYPSDVVLPTDISATVHSTPSTASVSNELRPLLVPSHLASLASPASPASSSLATSSAAISPSHPPPSALPQPSPLSAYSTLQPQTEKVEQEAFIEGGNCGGCKRFVGPQEVAPGTLITFGDSLFHLDCFRCVKCQNRVTEDTNLLLLADGSPVCTNCSYQCYVCKLLIMDEAIMTGDEAYHAACFTCKHCKCTIEELVFAKTSQGIYCMSCHNKRVAKSRKHAEAKRKRDRKEREKERLQEKQVQQDLQNDLDGSRAQPEISFHESETLSPHPTSLSARSPTAAEDTHSPVPRLIPRSPSLSPSPSMSSSLAASGKYRELDDSTQPQSLPINPHSEMSSTLGTPVQKFNSPGLLSLDGPEHSSARYLSTRRGSEDSRLEPLSRDGAAFGLGLGVGPVAGSTSRSEKRRSINPATFSAEAAANINPSMFSQITQPPAPSASAPLNLTSSTSVQGSPSLGPNSNITSDGRLAGLPPSPLRSSYMDGSLPDHRPSSPVSPNGRTPSRPLRPLTPDRVQPTTSTAPSPYSIAPLAISVRRSRSREGPNLSSVSSSTLSQTPPRKSSLGDHRTRPIEDRPGRRGNSSSVPRSPSGRSLSPSSAAGEKIKSRSGSLTFPLVGEDDELSQPSGQFVQPIGLPRTRSPLNQSTAPPHVVVVDNDDDNFKETSQVKRQAHIQQDVVLPPSLGVDSLPERRSSVSQDPPKLESPRPVSFLLSNDPEFAMLFKTVEDTGGGDGPMDTSLSMNHDGITSTLSNGIPIEFRPSEEFRSDDEDEDDEADEDDDEDEDEVDVDMYVNVEDEEKERDDVASELPSRLSAESIYDSKPAPAIFSSPSSSVPTSGSTAFFRHGRRDRNLASLIQQDDGEPAAVLRSLLVEAKNAGKSTVEIGLGQLEGVLEELRLSTERFAVLKNSYDGVKRASAQYIHGLTVQSEDFEKEVQTRREVEAEIKRLRAQMHGQTARLSLLDADQKRQDSIARRSRELTENMVGLEKDISKLRAERDLALAEVEELSTSSKTNLLLEASSASAGPSASLSRSLSVRLDSVKENYRKELEPLNVEREKLSREITELKESREFYLSESTTLHARNEELSDLHATLVRQIEQAQETLNQPVVPPPPSPAPQQQSQPLTPTSEQAGYFSASGTPKGTKAGIHLPRFNNHHRDHQQHVSGSPSVSSLPGFTSIDGQEEIAKYVKVVKPEVAMDPVPVAAVAASSKKFKWYKSSSSSSSSSSKGPEAVNSAHASSTSISSARIISLPTAPVVTGRTGAPQLKTRPSYEGKSTKDHNLQPHSIPTLRFTRCDHCGDKMWGPITELRCNLCGFNCHSKCVPHLVASCPSSSTLPSLDEAVPGLPTAPSQPSMFGRSLQEQIQADGVVVPCIVSKCIAAVEDNGMEYEGIYRKTGGSSQSKHITQLFERGDYDSFDLNDQDKFNDISSITSVLKNYFRGLPDPLLTFELHEKFVSAAMIRDPEVKKEQLSALIHQLPKPHFETLKFLMLHLNRVMALQSINLMSAKNLGVVFGPTLMRSADRSREFGDMAGKALTIDWLVENASSAFAPPLET